MRIATERFGGLDVAFANAGVFGEATPIVDYPEAVFDHVMAVNVKGSFLVAKHALAVMRDGGSLIFNSSVVGLLSDAGIAGYATSKHAIVGLMRTAAREVADRGIRVNSLHPGPGRQPLPAPHRGHRHRRSRGPRGGALRGAHPASAPRRARGDRALGALPGQRRQLRSSRPRR